MSSTSSIKVTGLLSGQVLKDSIGILVTALILMAFYEAMPKALAQGISHRDIHYSSPPDQSRTMDIYVPKDAVSPPPVILWIHGGGWIMGDKSPAPANELVGHGFAVASINYRFATQAKFPAQLDDCLAAIAWLKAHAGEFHIDANDLAIIGESSGGHLAALIGTMPNTPAKAVITLGAPTDLASIGSQAQFPGQKFLAADGGQVATLLGTPARKNPELAFSASPVKYASRKSAPFLIMAGTLDQIVPIEQSSELNDRLKAQGAVSELIMVPGASHALQEPDWQKPGIPFLDKYLNHNPIAQKVSTPSSTDNLYDPGNPAATGTNPALLGRESAHERRARRRALYEQQNGVPGNGRAAGNPFSPANGSPSPGSGTSPAGSGLLGNGTEPGETPAGSGGQNADSTRLKRIP